MLCLGSNNTIPAPSNEKSAAASDVSNVKKEKIEDAKPKPAKLVKKVSSR